MNKNRRKKYPDQRIGRFRIQPKPENGRNRPEIGSQIEKSGNQDTSRALQRGEIVEKRILDQESEEKGFFRKPYSSYCGRKGSSYRKFIKKE